MGARAEPGGPKPYDPDGWARRWGLVGAGMLLVGAMLRSAVMEVVYMSHSELRWREDGFGSTLLDVVEAAAAGLLVIWLRGGLRGATLAGLALTATAAHVLSDSGTNLSLLPLLWWPVGVCCFVACGAANHVRKRWPMSGAARLTMAIGAVLLVIDENAFLYVARRAAGGAGLSWMGWLSVAAAWVSIFALLAFAEAISWQGRNWRRRLVGWLAVGLPTCWALLRLVVWIVVPRAEAHGTWISEGSLLPVAFGVVRDGLLDWGSWVLFGVGLAAWLEARLAARDARSSPEALDRVFQ